VAYKGKELLAPCTTKRPDKKRRLEFGKSRTGKKSYVQLSLATDAGTRQKKLKAVETLDLLTWCLFNIKLYLYLIKYSEVVNKRILEIK
jgi:hypothetical protein